MRHRLEGDGDLGIALRHALAGAQIDRDARPAPGVELAADRDEGLGTADMAELLGIAFDPLAVDHARPVLAAHRHALDIGADDRAERLQHPDLLVADGIGLELVRRLDREQAEQLQHMVLDHVAQVAGLVVIAGAGFQADGLGHGDLDIVDIAARPGALEQGVGEAQHQEVLHRLLAEVMVDPVGAAFRQDAGDGVVDLARRGEIAAERLFQDDARGRRQDAGAREVLADRNEQVRRRREVEGTHALGVAERCLQRSVGFGLDRVEQHHGEATAEAGDAILRQAGGGELAGDLVRDALDILLPADDAEDAALLRQHALLVALGQRREELAQGKVAAGPEDHQVEGRDRRALRRSLRLQQAFSDGVHGGILLIGPVEPTPATTMRPSRQLAKRFRRGDGAQYAPTLLAENPRSPSAAAGHRPSLARGRRASPPSSPRRRGRTA